MLTKLHSPIIRRLRKGADRDDDAKSIQDRTARLPLQILYSDQQHPVDNSEENRARSKV